MLILAAADVASQDSLDAVINLRLPDQYGQPDSLAEHRGHVVVVFAVTAKRLRNIKPWERHLRERIDGVQFLRITDVPADSKASYSDVAAKIRERVPEGVSVLIDMDRGWALALELDTGRPNLLIVDHDGVLIAT